MNKIWHSLSLTILKNRTYFLAGVALMTLFMIFMATKVQVSSELPKILPKTDTRFQLYESFKNALAKMVR